MIYLRARYYNPKNGNFLTEDPVREELNWYTYANCNPIRFIDSSGLDAIVLNNDGTPVGHMSAFVQDENDDWWFFIYGMEVFLRKLDDQSIISNASKLNEWLKQGFEVIDKDGNAIIKYLNQPNDPLYDNFVYIVGNFTASFEYYQGIEQEFINKPHDGWFFPNHTYNLLFNNCTHVTMKGLNLGILPDGTEMWDFMYKQTGLLGISAIPNDNLKNLQKAFGNTSWTKTGAYKQIDQKYFTLHYTKRNKSQTKTYNHLKMLLNWYK